jgi:hypothetical protein
MGASGRLDIWIKFVGRWSANLESDLLGIGIAARTVERCLGQGWVNPGTGHRDENYTLNLGRVSDRESSII